MHIKDLIPWARHGETARSKSMEPGATSDHPMAELQRQMNQVFESFWGRIDRPFAAGGWPFGEQGPRSDVVETDEGVEVTVELPGMEQEDVEVSLAGDTLTVKGEKKVERQDQKKGYYVSERSYGSVYRTIPLPSGVDTEKADASFRNGVLTVKIPHSPEARARVKRINVKAA
jgi:HSP20 family protein